MNWSRLVLGDVIEPVEAGVDPVASAHSGRRTGAHPAQCDMCAIWLMRRPLGAGQPA